MGLCLVRVTLAPQWDLALVLRALSKAPFEPLDQVPLKLLSAKVVGYYFWLYQRKG